MEKNRYGFYKSLSFGQLPTSEEFFEIYEKKLGDKLYEIRKCSRVGNVDLTASELWKEIKLATKEWDENGDHEAAFWVSSVLYTLSIEWI